MALARMSKKVIKPLEGLRGCNLFKEPKSFYTAKKVIKPFDRLEQCSKMFKEPKSFYTATTESQVSKYFEKQWGAFSTTSGDLIVKEAIVSHVPEVEEEETMYTRLRERRQ